MDKLEQRIRASLQDQLDSVDMERHLNSHMRRRIVRRKIVLSTASVAAALGVAIGGFLVAQPLLDSREQRDVSASSRSRSEVEGPRRISPAVSIASGLEMGKPWSLGAYMAAGTEAAPNASHLCIDWQFDSKGGPVCVTVPNAESSTFRPFSLVQHRPTPLVRSIFGVVDNRATRVEVETASSTENAQVHSPPKALGVDYRFFVGFAKPGSEVTVRAMTGAEVLYEQELHVLPLLTINKEGSGTGEVTGRHACAGDNCPKSIDESFTCGDICGTEMEKGGLISLRATAEPGSAFAGWRGACTGSGECLIEMDSNKSVVAVFEQSP